MQPSFNALKLSTGRQFFDEIQKVSWPTRQETIRLTLVVVAVSLFVGLYVGILDLGLTRILGFLTK
ncbi:MAG: preprotein translocase subunit SecE [bacterium]